MPAKVLAFGLPLDRRRACTHLNDDGPGNHHHDRNIDTGCAGGLPYSVSVTFVIWKQMDLQLQPPQNPKPLY